MKFLKELTENKSALFGLIIILFFVILGIFAPVLTLHGPDIIYEDSLRIAPSFSLHDGQRFLLGTDDLGRDILSRLIYGARISLSIGVAVVSISLFFGIILGLLSGYYGGKVDRVIMGMMDIIMSLPSILLAIVVVAVLGPGINNAIIAVSIVALPGLTRIVRSSTMAESQKAYCLAAKSFGVSDVKIMFTEILPNSMAPLIVQASLGLSDAILNTASLGFLGLGAQAPLSEWGVMLADSRSYIESAPWLVFFPGICILLVVLGFNLLGDGLRDVLDPKLKR
jgi:ABC-type dipeptide/oligopeptide/nickel transport system permease subunit